MEITSLKPAAAATIAVIYDESRLNYFIQIAHKQLTNNNYLFETDCDTKDC